MAEAIMFRKIQRLHFVGIGGSGMCGIAEVLLTMGFKVSGSDTRETPILERLRSLGALVHAGHRADQVAGAQAVVVSNAVADSNVEIVEARARKIPVIPRAEMLAELMRLKVGIAVAGTHGKTTTTSMTAVVLREGGLDPTWVIGGRFRGAESHSRLGSGDTLVVEADEAYGSFLHLSPILSVITNIDNDHLEFYHDMDTLKNAFVTFANKVPFYGAVLVCADDPTAAGVLPRITRRTVTYGTVGAPDLLASKVQLRGMKSDFLLSLRGKELGRIDLKVPGEHNVRNAVAAAGVGLEMDIPFPRIQRALSGFTGVDRRFQLKGEEHGVTVVDDFAHHPTEIAATLKAARGMTRGRLIALFQPHLFSRTQLLHEPFAWALRAADVIVLTDIYPAREEPIPGVTADLILQDLLKLGFREAHPVPDWMGAVRQAAELVRPGDLVMTIGAGSIWQAGEKLLELLKEKK